MIKVKSIRKLFNGIELLHDVSFVLNKKEKIGIIGKNGSGKTTLLKIIIGAIEPDDGGVFIDKNERIGYLPQTIENEFEKTIKIFFLDGQKIEEWKIKKYLSILGIKNINLNRKLNSFSGGEITRIALARVLTRKPTVLLIDEPTNNLDIEGINYLQRFLCSFSGGLLLVSHNRWILDKVSKKIIDLQITEKGTISKIYSGNFTNYQKERSKEIERQEKLYILQQKEAGKVKREIKKVKSRAVTLETSTSGSDFSIRKKAAKVVKQAKSREKRLQKLLESEKRIEKPHKEKPLKFEFVNYLAKNQRIIQAKNISFGFSKKVFFNKVDFELYGKDKAVLLGPNGFGKTSFLRVLLGETKPDYGEIKLNPSAKIGYLPQEIIFSDKNRTALEEFERDTKTTRSEARLLLGRFLGDRQTKKIKDLSIGERRKIYIAKIVASGANFLILDEPTNHLDISSTEAVEKALYRFDGSMLVVSHDRYFLKNIGIKKFYYLKKGKLQKLIDITAVDSIK